ncbi:uncharacterized protein LOC110223620 [Phascolarctos cinereus]
MSGRPQAAEAQRPGLAPRTLSEKSRRRPSGLPPRVGRPKASLLGKSSLSPDLGNSLFGRPGLGLRSFRVGLIRGAGMGLWRRGRRLAFARGGPWSQGWETLAQLRLALESREVTAKPL